MRTSSCLPLVFGAFTSFGQSQIRIDPDPTAGTTQALTVRSFEVVSPGTYAVFGSSVLAPDQYDEIGMSVFFDATTILSTKQYISTSTIHASVVAPNSDIIIVGSRNNLTNGLADAFVCRLNSAGDTLWTRMFDSENEEFFRAVAVASDGSIYAVGNVRITYLQTLVVKLSSSGSILWVKQETTSSGHKVPNFACVKGDSLLIFEQQGFSGVNDLVVRVLNPSGIELAWKRFGNSVLSENVPNVTCTNDGGFAVYVGFNPPAGNPRTSVVILDKNLNVVLNESKLLSVPGKTIFAFSITSDSSGDIYLAGSISSPPVNHSTVTKLANAAVSWTRTLLSQGAVTAKMHIEGDNLVIPSYGISMDGLSFGLTLSFLDEETGAILGVPCEPGLPSYSVVAESYENLSEIWLTPASWIVPSGTETQAVPLGSMILSENECGMDVLPSELLDFFASLEARRVKLSWRTASEHGSDHFSVERSTDGSVFEEVARVESAGESSYTQDYEAFDEDPLPGISYYRLRQVDVDGRYEFSNIVPVSVRVIETSTVSIGMPIVIPPGSALVDSSGRIVCSGGEYRPSSSGIYMLSGSTQTLRILVN